MKTAEKLANAEQKLNATLIERHEEVAICLTALAMGEHALLVAPPGTGKSFLAEMLGDLLSGNVFRIQLSKTTEVEELVGPMDLAEFKQGRYRRRAEGKMPNATVALLDEVFKGSSAVLNVTLSMLQERRWFDGTTVRDVPLRCAIGTSNEFPDPQNGGKELAALFDRFLFRQVSREVDSLSGTRRLMFEDIRPVSWDATERISDEELAAAQSEIDAVQITPEIEESLLVLVDELAQEGVRPGDRRRRKSARVCRAAAWRRGSAEVEPCDLHLLAHTLYSDPEQRLLCAERVVGISDVDTRKLLEHVHDLDELDGKIDGMDPTKSETRDLVLRMGHTVNEMKKLNTPKLAQYLDPCRARYNRRREWVERSRMPVV